VFGTRFLSRSAKVFLPEAQLKSRGTIARSPTCMHHRSSLNRILPLHIRYNGPLRQRIVLVQHSHVLRISYFAVKTRSDNLQCLLQLFISSHSRPTRTSRSSYGHSNPYPSMDRAARAAVYRSTSYNKMGPPHHHSNKLAVPRHLPDQRLGVFTLEHLCGHPKQHRQWL
jgi:hypothetical protein